MGELAVLFDKDSPRKVNDKVLIEAAFYEKALEYKFIIGYGGTWNTIQEYSKRDTCIWTPKKEGKYFVMVQGRKQTSKKPFDCKKIEEFYIGKNEFLELRLDVRMNKTNFIVGEKLELDVETSEEPLLYRFWIKGKQDWEPIRDYTMDSKLVYTTNKEGKQEILIECKRPESVEVFDSFTTVRFDVVSPKKIEITGFRCLTEELLINEELVFKVEASIGDKRTLLYKFIKIDEDGRATCIQDYSSRKTVSYQEREAGKYRLLCLVRDILSNKEYDDRAVMIYSVKAYNEIKIKNFTTDIKSPQVNGSSINLHADVEGGHELLYRYIIDGPTSDDSGYIRKGSYVWDTKQDGEYVITLLVKDISYDGEYEDKRTLTYSIDKKGEKPVRINEIILDNEKTVLTGKPVNLKVIAEGGVDLTYSFLVYKDNVENYRSNFEKSNWFNFTPDEKGEYEIEVRVKDRYSLREYDSNTFIYLKVKNYLPGKIDHILLPNKETYLVGDLIEIEAISQNTRNILMRYVTKINGHLVEDTGFIKNKRLKVNPKCHGKYNIQIYAKNIKSEVEYDSKKEVSIYVSESTPVTDTKVSKDKIDVNINEEVTFRVESKGGKDVCYEFYIMEQGNWIKAQNYSRKHYYTFIPFLKGEYRVMVLSKSFYKKVNYEDYDELTFTVQ